MSIPKVSVRQVKAARALLGWSQEDLARAAAVSVPTVKRLEAADGDLGGRVQTGFLIVAALEGAGVHFLGQGEASEEGGAGVRLT